MKLSAIVPVCLIALSALGCTTASAQRYSATIIRDHSGIPHIYGDTDAATAFGLGYAHAEDDMDSIENAILVSRARLASKLGESALEYDRISAMLQGERIAHEVYRRDLSQNAREIAEGFAAGINRYLALHPGEGKALDRPVDGQDVVAFLYTMTPLFFGLDKEMRNAAGADAKLAVRSGFADQRLGSNAIAVAPSRSGDGVTRLMANSHQPWDGMLAWYESGFHSKSGLNFYGGQLGLLPFPMYGHNATLGWSYTLNRPKLTDVYRLDLDPANPHRYRWSGEWRETTQYPAHYVVKQANGGVREFDEPVEWTVHGPVFRVGAKAFAIKYASIGEAHNLDQYLGLMRSKTFAEWRASLRHQGIPSVNFTYADAEGNIGYFYNARLPKRDGSFPVNTILPGDQPAALWTSYLPVEASPEVVNPKSGFVFNANNGPFLASGAQDNPRRVDFPAALGIDAMETNRGQRLFELLSARSTIDRAALLTIKFDVNVSRNTQYLSRYLDEAAAVTAPAGSPLAQGAQLIRNWNRSFDSSSKGAVLASILVAEAEDASWKDQPPKPARDVLASAIAKVQAAAGTLDPRLGDAVRLRHGTVDLAIPRGGPDVVRAINSEPTEDGHLRATVGDSLMLLIEWGKDKRVHSWARSPYGAAPTRPDSPHFSDQSKGFVDQTLRPAWFYEPDVRANAERTYTVVSE